MSDDCIRDKFGKKMESTHTYILFNNNDGIIILLIKRQSAQHTTLLAPHFRLRPRQYVCIITQRLLSERAHPSSANKFVISTLLAPTAIINNMMNDASYYYTAATSQQIIIIAPSYIIYYDVLLSWLFLTISPCYYYF
jgi:hypothetical protein